MATTPTQDAVPSESPRDLKFNAGKIDEFVTSLALKYADRFGGEHYTIEGLRWLAQQAIAQYGWIPVGTFQAGSTITLPNQILKDTTDGEYYRWDGALPKIVAAGSTPASAGGTGTGAWLSIGDATLRSWVNSNISINFNSVTDMIAGKAISGNTIPLINGMVAVTFANQYGVKQESKWLISTVKDTTTYSVSLGNGGFANLICRADMNYAEFAFGGTAAQNVAAVDEGNRVARAQAIVRSLSFPAGIYQIGAFTLDVDKRAFRFWGAGWDSTMLVSTTSGISMHHLGIDPRDRNRDKLHFYQEVGGFMLDGNIDGNGASAASRSVCTAHYAKLSYKSVGHRWSNIDICALVVHWTGLTGSRTNGATVTQYGLRARYNSIKLDGYIGGASTTVACAIGGPRTTLAAAASAGSTTITVASATGFTIFDIIEIQGGTTLEAPYIIGISGNILTLDKPLSSSHTNGSAVLVPVIGTSLTGTVEVGQLQVWNSGATEIHGLYAEESRVFIYGYVDGLDIHGASFAQANPSVTIDSGIDRRSSIKISGITNEFTIAVNINERTTMSVNDNIDLYNWPEVDISQNLHSLQGIYVNGRYIFKSIKTERFYDSSQTPNSITSFKFTGLSTSQSSPGATEVLRFTQDSSMKGYDGHTFNLSATVRRATGLTGYLERKGQTSIIGSAISDTPAASYKTLNNYFSPVSGLDILFGSNTGRAGMTLRGEDAGGQGVKVIVSGEVTNVI
ncbi:hypothetical protein QLG07_12730 [Erwinia sp. V90_4]|uniref:tail fiber/spike domain-containing protein n=1 Tax=Erwinia sp. V90_4 TaxID=3044239 RepID=UPI00249E15E4|nr:hypothetical protein [Erwinia sp. V90_4]MDI3440326.1 hypothetical protein [Erwinia sp. V90_4]